MKGRFAEEYRKQTVQTAGPLQLVLMLYDGALRNMEAAKVALAQQDYFRQDESIVRAQKIVLELMACLDMEKGGEIAKNLMALYSFVLNELLEGNLNDDSSRIDHALSVMTELRDGWSQIEVSSRAVVSTSEPLPEGTQVAA